MSELKNKKIKVFAPGRIEVAGNHMDHQHGVSITGTIEQGLTANVKLRDDKIISVKSKGYEPFKIDADAINSFSNPSNIDKYTPASLAYGVACEFVKRGVELGGMNVEISSNLTPGIGLSSSAAFEMLFAVLFNTVYNDGKFSNDTLASIAYVAETQYYGKPCGILDQTAIVYGGVVKISFSDSDDLDVSRLDFSYEDAGLAVVLVNSGADHHVDAKFFDSIPNSMKKAAKIYGKDYLKDIPIFQYCSGLMDANKQLGNKAVLKSLHFKHTENIVKQFLSAMKNNDKRQLLYLHQITGLSSAVFLQNLIVDETRQEAAFCQGVCELALDMVCNDDFTNRGASRIHGGGFGGCLEVLLPKEQANDFVSHVNQIYGQEVATRINVTNTGAHVEIS